MPRPGNTIRSGQRPSKATSDPVGFWRRWLLRRQGRLDGRLGHPDPTLAAAPVVIPMRMLLQERLNHEVATIGANLVKEVSRWESAIEELDASLPHVREQLQVVMSELSAAEAQQPDPRAPADRYLRDREHSDYLARSRRRRKHRKTTEAARQRRLQLQNDIRDMEQRLARSEEEIVGLRRHAAEQAAQRQTIMRRELAIYQQSLLRRHPRAELLRPLLDRGDPELPGWVYRYAADPAGAARSAPEPQR